jgi:hypothetical protein
MVKLFYGWVSVIHKDRLIYKGSALDSLTIKPLSNRAIWIPVF